MPITARLTTLERFVLDRMREAWIVNGVLGPDMPHRCAIWVDDRQAEQGIPSRGRADGAAVLERVIAKGFAEQDSRAGFTWYRVVRDAGGHRLHASLRRREASKGKTLTNAAQKWEQRRAALLGAMSVAECTPEMLVGALDAADVSTPTLAAHPHKVRPMVAKIDKDIDERPWGSPASIGATGTPSAFKLKVGSNDG